MGTEIKPYRELTIHVWNTPAGLAAACFARLISTRHVGSRLLFRAVRVAGLHLDESTDLPDVLEALAAEIRAGRLTLPR